MRLYDKIRVLALGALALGLQTKAQILFRYDNFSGSSLNQSLWQESTFHGDPFPDFHGINTLNGTYQVIQNTPGDREVVLTPTHQFVAGDIFSYDLKYNSGSGNNLYQILLDGNYPPSVIPSTTPNPGSGTIGYWNGIPDVGNMLGKYHITESFFNNHISQDIVRPDGTSIDHIYPSVNEPYTFGLNIHTGNNGIMDFEIDNVSISQVPEPSSYTLVMGVLAALAGFALKKKR